MSSAYTHLFVFVAIVAICTICACNECEKSNDCTVGQVCFEGNCQENNASSNPENDTGGCDTTWEVSATMVDFGEVSPNGDPSSEIVNLTNTGADTARLSQPIVKTEDPICGEFTVESDLVGTELGQGEHVEISLIFTPDPDAEPGCGCHAVATVQLQSQMQCEVDPPLLQLVAAGACAEPLYCDTMAIAFLDAIVDSTYAHEVTCYNLEPDGSTVRNIAVSSSNSDIFSVSTEDLSWPHSLSMADAASFTVTYTPTDEGDHTGEIVLELDDGDEMTISLSGTAQRARPLCESGLPEPPSLVLEADDYVISLESEKISIYPGTLRSQTFYNGEPPLVSDLLVTTGSFSDPDCDVWQNGHQFVWQDCDPDNGTIHNIHAVPHSEQVDEWIHGLAIWDEITVVGYEVDRIDYDNNSWWTDAGCNTLIITWICDGVLSE
ncbi:MAG: choice-of-anchor D domain-containing protein [Deltaproteobacteria bacterium]|nr:choice-of-anchor D domain-containing protein [Deltaproteobacteria bacterium]